MLLYLVVSLLLLPRRLSPRLLLPLGTLLGCQASTIRELTPCVFDAECPLGEVCGGDPGYCEPRGVTSEGDQGALARAPLADLTVSAIEDVGITCRSGASSCVTRARVTVANRGQAENDKAFVLGALFDPEQSVEVVQNVAAYLEPAQALLLQLETPAGPDCSPYCRVCVTADVTELVDESDENNNQTCSLALTNPEQPIALTPSSGTNLAIDDFEDADAESTAVAFGAWSCFTEGAPDQHAECGVAPEGSLGSLAYAVSFELGDPVDGESNRVVAGARIAATAGTVDFERYIELVLSARLEATAEGPPPEGVLYVRLGCSREGGALEGRALLGPSWETLVLRLNAFSSPSSEAPNCRGLVDSLSLAFEPALAERERSSGRLWLDSIYLQSF